MRGIFKYTLLLLAWTAISCAEVEREPIDWVDPMIGTGFHGHTYPGATTPFGMVQLSPDTRQNDWDACSGYHYSDTTIDGFSHTHLSGTGCNDLGDIMCYPSLRADLVVDGHFNHRPYAFSHRHEQASAGYYAVDLPSEGLRVELTATPRTGVHRYTFTGKGARYVVIDVARTICDETVDMMDVQAVSDDEICGMRRTQGWSPDHYVYFSALFSEPFESVERLEEGQLVARFSERLECLTIVVGLSGVSEENARANRKAEMPEPDFEAARAAAEALWREALAEIEVKGGTDTEKTLFYTALYHTKLAPNLVSDVNGQFRRHDMTIGQLPAGERCYSTFSLWDTFRAWHPLQTLTDAHFVSEMIRSMLAMYESTGELPLWPLAAGETGTMIGYHATSVIADAYMKGIRDFDADLALEAMVRSSNINKKGSSYYTTLGYIPSNNCRESVSCTLEYAYDDWCIARMAEAMGRDEIASTYYERAANYVNVFDGSTGFFRGHRSDGGWTTPFEIFATGRDYTEATPWHYRFFVPHDVHGLEQLMGCRDRFVAALDDLFTLENDGAAIEVSDVTGLKGQYAQGNEPSHHMAYLYNYVGMPWRTQELTRALLAEMYTPTPEGIIGNEDCGQMSAWYIMSALGLYPVCPGSNEFVLTTPLFDEAKIRLANGKTLTITANEPKKNLYLTAVSLNERPIETNYLTYADLMEGGVLSFSLQPTPDCSRGTAVEAFPMSMSSGETVAVPYTTASLYLFRDRVEVPLATTTEGATIYYTLDGTEPTEASCRYDAPFVLDRSLTLRARAFKEGVAPSRIFTVRAERAVFLPAVAATATQPGVAYAYYEGTFARVADFLKLKPLAEGVMADISIAEAQQPDHFAYRFTGLVEVPTEGVWEFMTKSDDGSVLYIDGRKVVDNDTSHAAVAATGSIALQAGLHRYELLYFEDYEGEELQWGWRSSMDAPFESIPAARLFVK